MTPYSHAISISSMLEIANDQGEAEFTITNTEDFRQYISTTVSEVSVEKGELIKTPYTRDNISIWSLDVRPARTIVEPSFKKSFRISYAPKGSDMAHLERDRAYQVSFVPTPYFGEGDPNNTVKIAFGFAPIFIVPAKEAQPINYELRHLGSQIEVKNNGNSYFSLLVDGCEDLKVTANTKECSVNATLLAGRHMMLKLPEKMQQAKQLKAKLISHGGKFKVDTLLTQ